MTKRVLIIATDGFEQSELVEPRKKLQEAGFRNNRRQPGGGNDQRLERRRLGRQRGR